MDEQTCKEYIIQMAEFNGGTFHFLTQAIVKHHGAAGKAIIREAMIEMGRASGAKMKAKFKQEGIPLTKDSYMALYGEGTMFPIAWEGEVLKDTEEEVIGIYTYCPIHAGFKTQGAEELGDIYCEVIDRATIETLLPGWSCVREKTFRKDGVCQLRFYKK